MRADMLLGRGKYDDAAQITYLLLSKDRQNPDLLFLRGKALLYSGAADQGLKHLEVLCTYVVYTHTHTHTHARTHAQTHTHTYIHACIHTCVYTCFTAAPLIRD